MSEWAEFPVEARHFCMRMEPGNPDQWHRCEVSDIKHRDVFRMFTAQGRPVDPGTNRHAPPRYAAYAEQDAVKRTTGTPPRGWSVAITWGPLTSIRRLAEN
mgnify:CR=1 FL=1